MKRRLEIKYFVSAAISGVSFVNFFILDWNDGIVDLGMGRYVALSSY